MVHLLLDYGFDPRIESLTYWIEKYDGKSTEVPEWLQKNIAYIKSNDLKPCIYPVLPILIPQMACCCHHPFIMTQH